jgi:hypothetical protein
MKRINQLLVVLITVFLTSQLVTFCYADPFVPKGATSGEPSPPMINVVLPKENQTFEVGSTIMLNFSVAKPLTPWNWTKNQLEQGGSLVPKFGTYYRSVGEIKLITYSLDGKSVDITRNSQYEQYGILYYYFPVYHLYAGWHHIEIHAEGSGRYGELLDDIYIGSKYTANDLPTKPVNSTIEINFLVGHVKTESSPLPSSPLPQSATPHTTNTPLYSPICLLPFAALIVIVAILFLLYSRRRKRIQHAEYQPKAIVK